ncbi:hypothetical protein [Chryseobacterium sp.]|uniref:hypothetical protein n=1 Tax=Chryseobacterium sp. TaxID=1871047 RepID=UPI00289EA677|nr:hypothetical protein [Chryseobacterium sp.]
MTKKLKSKFVQILLTVLTLNSCNQKDKNPTNPEPENSNTENMISQENPVTLLTQSMTEYMETTQPSYSKKDIEECGKILTEYLSAISESQSKDEGMKIVQNTVEKLNALNEKCDFELIETSEREQIAEIIILAGSKKGYNTPEEDITEDWREW